MRTRMSMSALAVLALLAAPILAFAQAVQPICSDNSRACLIATATRYIDGLRHHNAAGIPFAPAARWTEQGDIPVTDAAKFRSEIDSSTAITGVRNLRLVTGRSHSIQAHAVTFRQIVEHYLGQLNLGDKAPRSAPVETREEPDRPAARRSASAQSGATTP